MEQHAPIMLEDPLRTLGKTTDAVKRAEESLILEEHNVCHRKCTDLWCVVIFLCCWGVLIYVAFFSSQYKVLNNTKRALFFMQPADEMRRVCGNETQADVYASDYTTVVSNFLQA